MNDIRVRFVRGEEVKYISHLDLMKTFERAIRRSGIPIAYSKGFNPHPHMVFGLPLSVGVTSESEYADFEFFAPVEPEKLKEELNTSLPKGLRILCAKRKNVKDNIMASISMARYMILLSTEQKQAADVLKEKLDAFMQSAEIIVRKESKKGTRDMDIRPMIYSIGIDELEDIAVNTDEVDTSAWLKEYIRSLSENMKRPSYSIENIFCISALLSAGSVANLKPELLVSALETFLNAGLKTVKIHRKELFVNNKGEVENPLAESILGSNM